MMSEPVVPTITHDESRSQQLLTLKTALKNLDILDKERVSENLDMILSNENAINFAIQKTREQYDGRSASQPDMFRPTLHSNTGHQSAEAVLMTNPYRKKNSGRNPLSEQIRTPTHPFAVSYPQLSKRAQALKSNNNNFIF